MCGICGTYNPAGLIPSEEELRIMTRRLTHRGPDDEGYFTGPGIGLGHRRLSIIDLTSGRQPIHSEDKAVWLVVNGEIYNFPELRRRLEQQGHVFYTRTDVEVIPHLYEEHGEDFVCHLRGMFSLALWDSRQEKLILARDRAGEKPLCYWEQAGNILFASELQALVTCSRIPRRIDADALDMYLGLQYVPAPRTIFEGVRKLEPAHLLVAQRGSVRLKQYWRLTAAVRQRLTVRQYEAGIRERLSEAVRLRLVSDVPMGVLLSGGIDSSAVLSYAGEHKPGIRTFSIGFAEDVYNELPYARMMAAAAKASYHEHIMRPQVEDVIPRLARHFGEPFADSSAIPTFCLAQFAANHAKVVLTGDGGDELFAGYDRYLAGRYSGVLDTLPHNLRRLIGRMASGWLVQGDVHAAASRWQRFLRTADLPPAQRYLSWISAFSPAERQLLYQQQLTAAPRDLELLTRHWPAGVESRERGSELAAVDRALYLPDDLLAKVDIASMSFGLEARAVFLDHVLMEYVAAIPFELKIRFAQGKYILRRALRSRLPPSILRRPKQGFGVPLYAWLRGPLADFLAERLNEQAIRRRGLFRCEYVERLMREFRKGADHSYKLWTLLMFESWAREFIDKTDTREVERRQ